MSALHIPDTCGVMLLPDCTLFPHGGLPLRIFEPRYRRMLEEAIEGTPMFAVARLLRPETKNPADCVAPVGTIGLIRASRQQSDGTSHLLLHGVLRVRFTGWRSGHSYPVAEIEPRITFFEPAHQAAAAAKTLRGSVEDAIRMLPEDVRHAVMTLVERTEDPVMLTDVVAQQFVQDPVLRQRLLEMDSAGERIGLICDYLHRTSDGD